MSIRIKSGKSVVALGAAHVEAEREDVARAYAVECDRLNAEARTMIAARMHRAGSVAALELHSAGSADHPWSATNIKAWQVAMLTRASLGVQYVRTYLMTMHQGWHCPACGYLLRDHAPFSGGVYPGSMFRNSDICRDSRTAIFEALWQQFTGKPWSEP